MVRVQIWAELTVAERCRRGRDAVLPTLAWAPEGRGCGEAMEPPRSTSSSASLSMSVLEVDEPQGRHLTRIDAGLHEQQRRKRVNRKTKHNLMPGSMGWRAYMADTLAETNGGSSMPAFQ